ncbi:MAG: hypothetical protein ACRCZ5_10615, partial [Burkholderiales bacterium]
SSDSTSESLGGNGQGQGAGRETGEVLTDHRRIPLIGGLLRWKTHGFWPAGVGRGSWRGDISDKLPQDKYFITGELSYNHRE